MRLFTIDELNKLGFKSKMGSSDATYTKYEAQAAGTRDINKYKTWCLDTLRQASNNKNAEFEFRVLPEVHLGNEDVIRMRVNVKRL